jgi:hypothetical protein
MALVPPVYDDGQLVVRDVPESPFSQAELRFTTPVAPGTRSSADLSASQVEDLRDGLSEWLARRCGR